MEDYLAWKWYRIFGYVNKLRWVYETDPEEIDVPDGYRVNRGNRLRVYTMTQSRKSTSEQNSNLAAAGTRYR